MQDRYMITELYNSRLEELKSKPALIRWFTILKLKIPEEYLKPDFNTMVTGAGFLFAILGAGIIWVSTHLR